MTHRKEKLFREALTELAEAGVPVGADLWPRVQTRLKSGPAKAGAYRPRWVWVVAGLGAVILLATAAYAGGPLADGLLKLAPGWSQVGQAGLTRYYGLGQSRDGWTVRLERAYADPNQVLVVLWAGGPAGFGVLDVRGELFTADGRPLRPELGAGARGRSEILRLELKPDESGHVLAFDGWDLGQASGDVVLKLSVRLARLEPEGFPGGGGPTPMRERELAGPFWFEFRVPVAPARAEVRGKEAAVGGRKARLERLVAAPSGLKLRACFEGLADGPGTPRPAIPRLVFDPELPAAPVVVRADGPDCYRWSIPAGLAGLSGRRTIKFFGPDGAAEPWTFDLNLP